MANFKRKHKLPRRAKKCILCMSKKLAFGRLSDKDKIKRKQLDKDLKDEGIIP